MQLKLFTIPITDNGRFLEELNLFLRTHKILELENHLINNEKGASWCFCVKYIENNTIALKTDKKPDYKAELKEHEFKKFSKLREIRKQLADENAVPAYAVFTDEELANIARLETINVKNLQTINGIGQKKVEKYGDKLITAYIKTDNGLDFLNEGNN